MKYFFISILIFTANLQAQNYTLENIRKDINDIFKIKIMEYNNKKFAVKMVDTLKPDNYLHNFVQENRLALDYLLQNQLKINNDSLYKLVDDSVMIRAYFNSNINTDSSFVDSVLILVNNYLESKGEKITDFKAKQKYSVNINKILNLSARFFYPYRLVVNGFAMKLCVAALSFKDYEGERNYLEEAFTFSVVMGSAQTEQQKLIKEYKKVSKYVIRMNLSNDETNKLDRIQGAVWALLAKNEELLKHIKNKYEEVKNIYPFKIIF